MQKCTDAFLLQKGASMKNGYIRRNNGQFTEAGFLKEDGTLEPKMPIREDEDIDRFMKAYDLTAILIVRGKE